MGVVGWCARRVYPRRLQHRSDISTCKLRARYAAYGGVFVVMSIFWGWAVDGVRPDVFDIVGMLFCLVGVGFIMYAPRSI